nr:leucine-rich repeat domain-containing protein [uncultured Kingella sp.]
MKTACFPTNSDRAYAIFEDGDNLQDLKTFLQNHNLSRVMFSGALGYGKFVLPFDADMDEIEEVCIQYSQINDLTPLYHLSKVKKLVLEENLAPLHVFDIRKMTRLLDFFTDSTLKIDGLFSHPALRHLHIEPKKTKKLDIAGENHVLESLSIANSHLSDLTDCQKLPNLKFLSLAHLPKIECIDFILTMPKLAEIEICTCKKIDGLIETLAQKGSLKALTLWNQGDLASITPLAQLAHLAVLNIWEKTKILDGKIAFLNEMGSLKKTEIRRYAHYDWTAGMR